MVTMPGAPSESWSPEGEAQTKAITAREPAPYKPEMGLQVKQEANPLQQYLDDPIPAQRSNLADVGWKERFIQHFRNAQQYGTPGINELSEIRDAEQGYVSGQAVGKEAGALTADFLREQRRERQAQFEGMKPAETLGDYAAAVSGAFSGAVADPVSLMGPVVKLGTAGWRMSYPILSRILDHGVSNAAMNAALNATVQAEEYGADMREEVDWLSLGIDAAAGFGFGLPFGYLDGRAAKNFYAREAARGAPTPQPEVPPAPDAPEVPPLDTMGTPTPDQMQREFSAQDLAQAQVDLFGEVVGTRNMTPEQLNQLDDYLNGGMAGDIPQAEPETPGGLTPEQAEIEQQWDELTAGTGETADTTWTEEIGSWNAPPVELPGNPVGDFVVQQERQPAPAPLPLDRTERQFSPSDLKVDAKRFQFKEGGDEAGVTDRLKGVKNWDPIKSGVTLVWEDLNGDFYIADGHQRHGLASRLEKEGQQPKIRAVVLREADGVTAEDARAIAAAKNIAEGTGNAIDAAKILRSRPDMGVDLPPSSALVRDAQGLASLSDDAFGMVINKKVPAGYAAQVGRLAPDPKTHAELLGLLAKEQPDNAIEAESMIRDALEAPAVQSTMEDMFGSAEVTQILFKERAQVLSAAATAIRKDRAAFATLVKEEARLTGAGNKLATQTNAERAAQDAEILATLQAQARRKGPVADALAAAARKLKDGTSRQVVVRDFLDELRRSSAPTGQDGGGAGPAGRESEAGIAARLEPDAPAFRSSEDVSGTYYVARIQREGSRSIRGKNAGNIQGVARHAGQLDDIEGPAFAGGSGNSIAIYKITAPPQAPGKYQPSTKKGSAADSAEIGITRTVWADGQARIAYSFGKDANFTEEFVGEVPLSRAQEALTRLMPESKGSFDFAGDALGSQAIAEALEEILSPPSGIAFARRPPIDKGPSLFDAMPPARAPRVRAFQAKVDARSRAVEKAAAPLLGWRSPEILAVEQKIKAEMDRISALPEEEKPAAFAKYRADLDAGVYDAPLKAEATQRPLPPGVTIKKLPNGDFSAVHNGQQIGFLSLEKFGEAGKNREAFQMAVKPEWQRKGIMAALHDFAEKDGGPITPSRTLSDEGFAFWKGYRPEAVRDRLRFDKEKYLGQKVVLSNGRTGVVTSVGDRVLIATIDGTNGATTMIPKAEQERLMAAVNPPPRVEPGADNKPQLVIPGAERIGDKTLAERRAAAPLRPKRAQKQMDFGLFSDDADQQGFAFRDEMIGTGLPDLIANNAPIEEIANHPFVLDAVRRMAAVPLTHQQPGYMSPEWKARRTYSFKDGEVVGYDNAITRLTEDAKAFSTNGPVKAERVVTILLGPPAAGKSTHAEKIAAARFAAIVDPDEAKNVIPEMDGGIGANAVHEESAEMAADILYRLTQEGANMVIPKVGGSPDGIRKLVLSMKRQGYRVNLVSMNVTYENAFRRMIGRFLSKGRLINPEYVAEVGVKPTTTYWTLREEGVADGYAEIDGNGPLGQIPQLLDSTGALDGVPGYGPGRGGDGGLSPEVGSARAGEGPDQGLDPLTQPGAWRDADIMAVDETGKAVVVNAGDAVDFMVTRIESLRQLLECVNAG